MNHDSQRRPEPTPRPETMPYWEAASRDELMLQVCRECDRPYFYPRPFCPTCLSEDVVWTRMSGDGSLHSFLIAHRPVPGYSLEPPYVIALVELREGPRMLTNLVDVEPDPSKLDIGMSLTVTFEQVGDFKIPQFRPAAVS